MRPVPTEPPGEIRSIAGALGVDNPGLEWAAVQLYFKAKEHPGRPFDVLRAAAVYASCRLLRVPKTLKDVSAATGVRACDIAREYRRMLLDEDLRVRPPDPLAFVPDIARKAGLEPTVERRAVEILSKLKEARAFAGRAPTVFAAASLRGILGAAPHTRGGPADPEGHRRCRGRDGGVGQEPVSCDPF